MNKNTEPKTKEWAWGMLIGVAITTLLTLAIIFNPRLLGYGFFALIGIACFIAISATIGSVATAIIATIREEFGSRKDEE